jgi:hypothetical protein
MVEAMNTLKTLSKRSRRRLEIADSLRPFRKVGVQSGPDQL